MVAGLIVEVEKAQLPFVDGWSGWLQRNVQII